MSLRIKHDGSGVFEIEAHNPRMDFNLFKQIHKGRPATQEELKAARIGFVPDGYSAWRKENGTFLAIRDE
ncbi:hypothetical protein VI06_20680 [Aquitalea magnusonii]|nr:hypothetical protein VI06_20680 [Aquitalea magnusonii]